MTVLAGHELQPLPALDFECFCVLQPPMNWAELVVMYNEETRGYPCANYHAVLVQEVAMPSSVAAPHPALPGEKTGDSSSWFSE